MQPESHAWHSIRGAYSPNRRASSHGRIHSHCSPGHAHVGWRTCWKVRRPYTKVVSRQRLLPQSARERSCAFAGIGLPDAEGYCVSNRKPQFRHQSCGISDHFELVLWTHVPRRHSSAVRTKSFLTKNNHTEIRCYYSVACRRRWCKAFLMPSP